MKELINKKSQFNYFLEDNYTAGIVLKGCEIKPIRMGDVNMSDSYCVFCDNELFVKNLHISMDKNMSHSYKDYDPKRDRKLLLTKHELRKLEQKVKIKGYTIIPVKMFINEHGLVKMVISLGKGKHTYDKSKSTKEKEIDRNTKRELKTI